MRWMDGWIWCHFVLAQPARVLPPNERTNGRSANTPAPARPLHLHCTAAGKAENKVDRGKGSSVLMQLPSSPTCCVTEKSAKCFLARVEDH
ncbi:hypothetical protein B0T26DRAFT_733255 [Lasiosphaeria miniovina]|uniref:Secreted protein n=1 Tax=Lasiosphaeria miniovina TaxID=1954250 RepID=A0AA39ZUJ6_9PEZI|nr:uncharacterized protein B0T26DRAFT_733255 [Lasiosphaeria miniovina]KAK0703918.1 hypothetical protein B0T26DRAFT_733255 [Lasiosphaeria miniovina]